MRCVARLAAGFGGIGHLIDFMQTGDDVIAFASGLTLARFFSRERMTLLPSFLTGTEFTTGTQASALL
jgi:hypothetical protein